ncbi:efflux RND transporter periplasmic adaptor subunit [bacterium]|nr:efflux RND transporter periplasmic adaptor subunit [bacterium]
MASTPHRPFRPALLHALVPLLLTALLLCLAPGCGKDEAPAAGGPGGPGGGKDPQARDQQPIPVMVAPAIRGPIASYFNATATLEARKEAEVLARATGVVGELFCEEGDEVAAGQPLLTIVNDEYRLRLKQAEAATANLRARFQRLEAMLAEELATAEEFEAARSDLARAEADEGLARLDLGYTTVRAPFTGRVTRRLVDVGQNMAVGTPLVVMADFKPLLARIHVPSREFKELRRDQKVDLVLDSDGEVLEGVITLVSPIIDPESGTIKLTVEIPEYPPDTRPGDFAQVRIVTELRPDALLVPRTALVTDKGESLVYLTVEADGGEGSPVAERRVVTVGFTDDEHAEITAGLQAGELVVVRGQRSLKHGAPVKVLGEESPGGDS